MASRVEVVNSDCFLSISRSSKFTRKLMVEVSFSAETSYSLKFVNFGRSWFAEQNFKYLRSALNLITFLIDFSACRYLLN